MSRNYSSQKGTYIVQNKEKYIGSKDPSYRSSWECRCMYFFDNNPNVIRWSFEALEIPYLNVMDKKVHRYYPDFYVEMIDKDKQIKKFIIEVKPAKQSVPPKAPRTTNGRSQRRYMLEAKTYVINQCKWEAAKEYCKKLGYEFKTIDENDIFTR